MNEGKVEDGQGPEKDTTKRKQDKSKTPMLDMFGKDLTKLAAEGKLEAVIGREKEIDRVIQILSRKKKNNPVLVGEPGVGKTAIAEGIAKKILEKKVSRILHGKRIVTLDLSLIVAGTKYRGQFEERMKAIMEEIEQNTDVIIFIDELHTIIGAGNSSGSLDASNMLKPALARGYLQVIGATTLDEYKKSIEKDGAMERRFQKVMVEPTSIEETKEILHQIKHIYEDHHKVKYDDAAIDAAVDFSERYITARFFPDKAIDIMDECGSRVHIDNMKMPNNVVELEQKLDDIKLRKDKFVKQQKYEEAAKIRDEERNVVRELEIEKKKWEEIENKNKVPVTEADVASVVAKMINIPTQKITEDEGIKIVKMGEELKKEIVGQDEAVEKVCEAIQRNKSGLSNPKKPIASLLFLGSTGIGKTQLAKALAKHLFNDENALIKIDMSEYTEPHSISRLIGSPPGYVGYEEGGQLTEKVKNRPYSIILFDEIEKAHRLVYNLLLQILDEGALTDGLDRKINFKNTIVIMTSNIGTKELTENKSVGFDTGINQELNVQSIIMKAMKKYFRPEFINRIDEQIVFNRLSTENIAKITEIELENLFKLVRKQGFSITVTQALKDIIIKDGFSDEFGARPILRMITKYVQNPVSKEILLKKFKTGDTIKVDWDKKKDEPVVSLSKK